MLKPGEAENSARPENFDQVLAQLIERKNSTNPGDLYLFRSTLRELEEMADGGNAGGIRETYYTNWEDEDFDALLDALDQIEEGNPGENNKN